VFWLQTALSAEKSGAARADSTRPSGADCGVFSLTGLFSVATQPESSRRFGVYAIKKIARNNGTNLFEIQTDLTVFVPVAKALNHSRLSRAELTRLWLARLGQPSLDMVNRTLRNGKAIGPIDKLMSNLNECNWIQTKGNFRMKPFKKSEYGRCEPGGPDESPGSAHSSIEKLLRQA
jgi:hypothetical protein